MKVAFLFNFLSLIYIGLNYVYLSWSKNIKIKRPVTMLMTGGHTGLLGIVTKPCCQLQRNKTNYESKFSPKMTVKCQEKVLKCDKPEIQS